jgi:hypothetical protein
MGRIMTGQSNYIHNQVRTYIPYSFLVGPDMSVSTIDISALASQLTSNFLASLTNATVLTTSHNGASAIPIK